MARTGITYSDVENVVQQLLGRGKNPTVDGIREVLGTGSKSTIAQHLRALRTQYDTDVPGQLALPRELLSLVTGLWEKVNEVADQRVGQMEADARQQIESISQVNNQLQQECTILSTQKITLEETLLMKERALDERSKQLADEQQKNHMLLIQQEAYLSQLEETKNENQRLHQLATHIQANLEHYQAAIQKLQMEQNLVIEKQQAFFQQQLNELDVEAKYHRQKAFDTEHALQGSLTEVRTLTQQLEAAQLNYDALSQTAQQTALTLAKTESQLERELQMTMTHQHELTGLRQEWQTLRTQHAILEDQYQRIQPVLQQKEDTLEVLRQEKLFLLQENAELKGYFKKMNLTEAEMTHVR